MKYITNIFICLLIVLTTNVLSINIAYADNNDDGRPPEVYDGSKITDTAYKPDKIYTDESTNENTDITDIIEETELN